MIGLKVKNPVSLVFLSWTVHIGFRATESTAQSRATTVGFSKCGSTEGRCSPRWGLDETTKMIRKSRRGLRGFTTTPDSVVLHVHWWV
jgi:hypothetical protein